MTTAPTGDEPSLPRHADDNSPMISGRGTQIIADARGAYLAVNLRGLIAHLPPETQRRFRLALVRQAIAHVQQAVQDHPAAARVQTCLRSAELWLDAPSPGHAQQFLDTLAAEGLLPTLRLSDPHPQTIIVQPDDMPGNMMVSFAEIIRAADLVNAAWNASLVAQFVPILQRGSAVNLSDPDLLSELRRAHEASEGWQLEAAWAILHGRQPPPYPEDTP